MSRSIPAKVKPELVLAIRNASYQRSNAVELQELLNEPTVELPEQLHPTVDIATAGALIRQSLGIEWPQQLEWSNPHAALAAWRGAIEARGILVQ